MPTDSDNDNDKPAGRCPVCGGPGAMEFRPFCSRRCADVDLSRWLRGSYAIASQDDDSLDEPDEAALGGDVSDPRSARNPTRRHPH